MKPRDTGRFQPFSNLAQPFSIGLNPIGDSNFVQTDEQRENYLQEKLRLISSRFDDVFMADPDTIAAQKEVRDLVLASLRHDLPDETIEPNAELNTDAPLAACALLVQEDLVLMRKCGEHWNLVAACLCFPSSWNLQEKFGHSMETIHGPVPGIEGKMSNRINRIFDALKPQTPLWRENWSLEGDGKLRHDRKEIARTGGDGKKLLDVEKIWLRCEYQTLHKLPKSGDILFTIKIISNPLIELAKTSVGRDCLSHLKLHIDGLNADQLRYKGITDDGTAISNWLSTHCTHGETK